MRRDNWQGDFWRYIDAAETRQFKWGEFDCCLFAADVIKILTGDDPAKEFRGTYTTARQALRLVKNSGGSVGMIGAGLGFQEIPPLYAGVGDIMRLRLPGTMVQFGGIGAVCLGPTIAFLNKNGLERFSISEASNALRVRAWRI